MQTNRQATFIYASRTAQMLHLIHSLNYPAVMNQKQTFIAAGKAKLLTNFGIFLLTG